VIKLSNNMLYRSIDAADAKINVNTNE